MRLISIEQLREGDILKIALLYTDQKCSYKPLKEKIPDLMQAFPLVRKFISFKKSVDRSDATHKLVSNRGFPSFLSSA